MKRYSELILESDDSRHSFFMQQAIDLAINNIKNGGGPFAALVVKNDKVISQGVNRVTDNNDPTAHAEIVAIRKACEKLGTFQLDGCQIYSTCEPCPMCFGAIYWSRVDKVFFGATHLDAHDADFDDSFIYAEIKKSPESRKIPFIQIDQEDAVRVFKEWEGTSNKVKY